MPKFNLIIQMVAEISQFVDVSRWWLSAILIFKFGNVIGRRLIQQPVLPYRRALRLSIQKELCGNNLSACEMNRETYTRQLYVLYCTVEIKDKMHRNL